MRIASFHPARCSVRCGELASSAEAWERNTLVERKFRVESIIRAVAVSFALAGTMAVGFAAQPQNLVEPAIESLQRAAPRADADPTRPVYHFRAPAFWMN